MYVDFIPLSFVSTCSSAEEERAMAIFGMRCFSSKKMALLCFFFFFFVAAVQVRAQTTDAGFINIDCGIPENSSYVSGLTYVSDAQYTDTGVNYNVSPASFPALAQRFLTVRSFPDGARNCYTFKSIVPGWKYLIRATFLYGNYDLKNSPSVQFDLYLGVNLWKTINLTDPSSNYLTEAVTEAITDLISVCLVNTGRGTPFISGLDLRPTAASHYPLVNASRSLVLLDRFNMAPTGISIRYPLDPYDRYWFQYTTQPSWDEISANSTVETPGNDHFEVPSKVMQTAVFPANSTKLELSFTPDPGDLDEFYAVMYFAELQQNASRQFFVYLNGALLNDAKPFTPDFLVSDAIYNINPSAGYSELNISLVATESSTLPPLLNAVEVFSTVRNTNVASDGGDVHAMMAIKEWYQVKNNNWAGDPCSPKSYTWDGLNCTFNASGIPRVTALNLSYKGLIREISPSFASLSAIQFLDLSHNNLTGPIPAALAYIPSLKLLDLTDNQLDGSIPSALLERSRNKSITLRTDGNPNLCDDPASCESKPTSRQKGKTAAIVISCVVSVVVLFAAVIILYMLRKKQGLKSSARGTTDKLHNEDELQFENRKFTYRQLQSITDNFERIIGKGGFGTVYYGHLENDTEVAVKMLSQSSSQGTKEFLAEAQHLTRVHHKNLVSMVGYCMDGDHLALVYEFMSQGTLKDHIRGTGTAAPLSWEQRLQIALEAALGLEYLHTGCKPPLIHRDVKTTNILLNERLEAKISDFGLSRTFQSDGHSHVSTRVVGTMGYLDPKYYTKNQLSQKSDVYSFGVVLLELITGQPPVVNDPENTHLVEWVRRRLAKGNIEDVVDPSLQQENVVNSAWKVANVALACAAHASSNRPTMSDVVMQLKESLALHGDGAKLHFQHLSSEKMYTDSGDISQISKFDIEQVGNISDSEGPSAR
ncbi:putative leucine-rich repeat receptor-like serine/threonine-protein kinase At2g19230 isoform X1 [Musa acuminata AAA Group]|uniref:putative leucine-rich repeat receptor-like serine/threonine-protein kinase At2g19230 isoform X1 n=1 Tax=Musa acuminata AAA Group TaxID=214697 RepID=UPI0031DA739E